MLFTLCLVLLLTPLPTLQSPASERRNSTGSDMIKSNAILAPSLPKTIASLAKQNLQAIPKPDTGNHTISTTLTSRQKPPMVNGTKITKMKQSSTVIQVTLSTSPKPVPVTIKDKQTVLVNKTVLMVKTPSTSDIKTTKNKTVTNVVHSVHSKHTKPAADIGAKTAKVKTTPSANQTVAVNSPAISSVKNPQDKSSPPVIQKIQLPPMTAAASSVKVTKDKSTASVNHTISIKTPLESNDKTITDRPAITVAKTVPSTSTSGTTANKVKQTASVNQPTSVKTSSDFKTNTDKPVLTVLKSSQSKPTKSDTVSTTTVTKEKFTSSVNRTVFNKTSSANDGKSTKVKSIPTLVQHHQPASIKPATTNGTSTSKDKLTDTANQTAVVKSHSNIVMKSHTDSDTKGNKVKPDLKVVQTVPSTKPATAGGNITNKDKSMPSVNQTHVIKSPTAGEGKAKEKPASMQPIKVVISEGCGSSNSKEQEVKLRPGSPLVMTHKISLIPGECSGGCVAEMAELKARVDRLEREMTSLKEQWNCPNECNGNGKCEMGKCICFLGFLGSDCSRCAPGANCEKKADKGKFKINVETVNMRISQGSNTIRDNTHGKNVKAEQTTFQKRDQRKGGESKDVETKPKVATNVKVATIKSQAKQESIVTKTNIKGPVSATKASEATLGQVLLKHKGKKQEEARKGRTTVLTAKELLPKADINQITIREAVVKSHAKSGQLQDQPQTNETLGTVKNTNGTAKVLTILTKVTETSNNKTKAGKGTLQQNVLNKKVKMESVDASKMASVENTKTQTGNIGSGKAKGTQKSQYLVNVTTVESGVPAENTKTQAGKIGSGKVKGPQKKQYSMNVTSVESGVSIANTRTRTGKIGSGKAQGTENNQYLVNVTSVEGGVSVETTKTLTGKIGSGKAKGPQKNQHSMNVTSVESRDATKVNQNKTVIQFAWNATRRAGGAGLGSVKISNISSYSFTLTWSAPQGMFRNFTVIRREHRMEGEGTTEEEVVDKNMDDDNTATTTTTTTSARNTTEVQTQREGTNVTSASAAKATGPKGKAEDQRVSMVLPGSVRSVEFGHLQPHTRYSLQVFGTALGKRSKIHRIAATTGPEPATELVFSNVTESSVTLSWSKPKSTFTGFKVTYTHYITGESTFETLDAQQSQMVLSKLSAGSSYIISVTTLHGKAQSDALTSVITTVPAPPAQFKAVNVTDTRALLQWTPSLGKVDRFIISYESAKIPNVTVTVMVSGNAVEHQLRGLQRGTVYTVKAMSQKGSLQSMVISTTFTTANMVKASEVGARFAVITWNAPTVVYHSYRLTYHVAGEVTKEVTLDRTITQYKLTGLLPMTHYTILVQGERDGQYTSIVTTDFVTGKLRFPYPTDCSQELSNGALHSGEVDIYPHGKDAGSFRVYCDMETDGGGWTVFQRRMNGKTDFYRTWNNYSIGFGNVSEEFWLGNRLLNNLTRMGAMSLRVDLRAGNDSAYAHYSNFTIDTEENHYSIMLSGYTGTAGDSMRYHNGRPFSTRDKDPQTLGIHCARAYMGGWWYKNCYKTNLNGLYGINSNNQGVVWIDWKGKDSSLPFTEMKIRPTAFSHATHDGGQL